MNTIIRKYSFAGLGLALTVAGVFFFILTPLEQQRHVIIAETATVNAKLADYQVTMNTINEYLLRRQELQSQKDLLTARLYNKKEVVALIEHLKISAQNRDLAIREITPSLSELLTLNDLPPADGSPRYLDIAMRYTGSFRDATLFLATLEQEAMFVELQSVNIISTKGGRAPAEYRIRFTSVIGGAESDHGKSSGIANSSTNSQRRVMAVGAK